LVSDRTQISGHNDHGRLVGGKAWKPTRKIVTQQTLNETNANLQELMRALWIPTHLLRLGHPLVDDWHSPESLLDTLIRTA
jgi:hypothetical protein